MTPDKLFAGFDRKAIRAASRRRALHRVLLSIWALFTLVLVFTVGLLAFEMIRQGQDPLASVKDAGASAPPLAANGAPMDAGKEITLYFADPDGRKLVAQRGRVELTDSTAANCRKALEALISGPGQPLTPVLPPAVKARGAYLTDNGELVVDFSMELESELKRVGSASVESLMTYSVVNTLTQPELQVGDAAVTSVRFLIEGAAPREAFPGSLDLSRPVFPNPEWSEGSK
jgi:hypothetical protein